MRQIVTQVTMSIEAKNIRAKVNHLRPIWMQVIKSTRIDRVQIKDFKKELAALQAMPGYSEKLIQEIMEGVADEKLGGN
mgnify:CR=1 FL=1